jgi:CubicO group peptidase (beta-lactamase class C family)
MIPTRRLAAAAATTLALVSTLACAAPPPGVPVGPPQSVGLSAERLARVDAYLDREIAAGHTSGGVVVVARRGRLAWMHAVGTSDLGTHRAIRTDDWFRLFSMTKPVAAVALLTLYEQGKFQLTEPLSKYLPAFAHVKVYAGSNADGSMILEEPKRAITIQDVFRHTAGFSYGYFGNSPVDVAYRETGVDYNKSDSLEILTDRLAAMPLLSQPGTRFAYSFSHDVLARLVEVISGEPFGEYCRRTIFEPLGMKETGFGVPAGTEARFPTTYSPNPKGGLVPTPEPERYAHFTQHPFGGVGLSSTPADYLRFAQMLLDGGTYGGRRILGRKTVELMTTDQLAPAGIPEGYPGYGFGLGIGVLTDPVRNGNLGSAGQFGWSGYATTTVVIDPKEQLIMMYFEQHLPEDRALLDYVTTLVYQSIVD